MHFYFYLITPTACCCIHLLVFLSLTFNSSFFNLVLLRVTFIAQHLFLTFFVIHLPFVSFHQQRVIACNCLLCLQRHNKSSTTTIFIAYCYLCVSIKSVYEIVSISMISMCYCGKQNLIFFSRSTATTAFHRVAV